MKAKRSTKLISWILTLAIILSMIPTAALAAEPEVDKPTSAEFKVMGLYSLRDNGRRVSYFNYETRENSFLKNANISYPDSWFKLVHVIEKSQPVTLELYEMKDDPDHPEYLDATTLPMPYLDTDTADGFGKLQGEDFLGERLGVIVGVPVQENVVPLNEGDDIYSAPKVGYSPIDKNTWWEIIFDTIRGEREPEVLENFYSFGYEGNQLEILNPANLITEITPTPTTTVAGSSA